MSEIKISKRRRTTASRLKELSDLLNERGKVTAAEMARRWLLSIYYVRAIFRLYEDVNQDAYYDPDEDALVKR